jgi:hypothetical protein
LNQLAPTSQKYLDLVNFNTYLRDLIEKLSSCCKDKTAVCIACQKQTTVENVCKKDPKTQGCSELKEKPRACCKAMTPSCLACSKGITEDEYCA